MSNQPVGSASPPSRQSAGSVLASGGVLHSGGGVTQGPGPSNWAKLRSLCNLLSQSSGVFGPLKQVVDELVGSIELFESAPGGLDGLITLQGELENLFQDLQKQLSRNVPPEATASIECLCRSIVKELSWLKEKRGLGSPRRYVEAIDHYDAVLASYRRIQGDLQRLLLNTSLSMYYITNEQITDARLDRICPAFSACYNSAQARGLKRGACTPGTRVDVLAQIHSWVDNHATGTLYWLNGMAGTGKTTISYSLCGLLDADCQLGASFFCSRLLPECRDVNRIIPSIAYQLANFSRPFRWAVARVLEKEKDVHTRLLEYQFEALILQPLVEIQDTLPKNSVVVIDALDECDDKQSTSHILEALLTRISDLPIKFFLASRPEPEVRDRIGKLPNHRSVSRLVLHELDHGSVKKDVETYLRNALGPVSPSNREIAELVNRTGILFIYAATVVRYVGYNQFKQNPRKRLAKVLDVPDEGGNNLYKDIDKLYDLILGAAVNDYDLELDEKEDRRQVLYTILCAQEPLTTEALSSLLAFDDVERVRAALQPLWSVLHVMEPNELVTTLHASFPDYVFDPRRSTSHSCNPNAQHFIVARYCFRSIMNARPYFNICGLESSYHLDDEVPDLEERANVAIQLDLSYACRHWAAHLKFAWKSLEATKLVNEFLSSRFLLWMEVMNIKKCMVKGVEMIRWIKEWCKYQDCPRELTQLAKDAWKFATAFTFCPVSRSTCHIYVSMLPFWPKYSPIGKHYASHVQGAWARGQIIARRQFALLTIWPTEKPVDSLIWSSDDLWIALVIGRTIQLCDSYSGQPTLGPLGQNNVTSVAFSPDNTRILAGSTSSTICMWDTRSGQLVLGPLEGHTAEVTSVAFSPKGDSFISGSRDKTMRVWDAKTGQLLLGPLERHVWSIASVVFSPDGSRVVSGSRDGSIQVWDTHTGKTLLDPLNGHTGSITSVAFSPNGTHVISSSYDKTVRLWSVRNGKMIRRPFEGHTSSVRSTAFSPDGNHIVSGSHDKTVIVWDVRTGKKALGPLKAQNDVITSVAFSPDGTRIASASSDQSVCIWNAGIEQCQDQDDTGMTSLHTSWVTSVAFSPDGTRIVSSSYDLTILLWDVKTGQLVLGPLKGHTKPVMSTAFSHDGTRIVSGSEDRSVRVWDAQTGQMVLGPLLGHTKSIESVHCSPSGHLVVSGSRDRTIYLWDSQTGHIVLGPLRKHTGSINSVEFSRDGDFLVSSSDDTTIIIWNSRTGHVTLGPLRCHTESVASASFSPDGTRIVSCSKDRTICVWDSKTGQIVLEPLRGHTGFITSVAFSPDGTRIVSSSTDRTIRMWDAQTGQTVHSPLRQHTDRVTSVAFSPDGAYIVSGAEDNNIHLWSIIDGQTREPRYSTIEYELAPDGWLTDKNTPPNRLVWVPADFRRSLDLSTPGSLVWSSGKESVCLVLDVTQLGIFWAGFYEPPPASNVSG